MFKLTYSISTRLAVIYAFIALLVASTELILIFKSDLKQTQAELTHTTNNIINTASIPASYALYEVNKMNGQTILNGLKSYSFITESIVYDDLGEIFVSASTQPEYNHKWLWLTQLLYDQTQQVFTKDLKYQSYEKQIGKLSIQVDYNLALRPFYERISSVVVKTFFAAFIVYIIIFIISHFYIVTPLMILVKELRLGGKTHNIDLSMPKRHENTELGVLVNQFNNTFRQLSKARNTILEANQQLEKRVKQRTIELEKANKELKALATQDPLTRINNRRNFYDLATEQFKIAKRHNRPMSVIMLDIDHFKSINDRFGHQTGDLAIISCVNTCLSCIRETDIIGRLGGEEFAIFLPEANENKAKSIALRIIEKISEQIFSETPELKVTISAGLHTVTDNTATLPDAIHIADKALYQSKNNGRNRLEIA